jgi:hypothetical protein
MTILLTATRATRTSLSKLMRKKFTKSKVCALYLPAAVPKILKGFFPNLQKPHNTTKIDATLNDIVDSVLLTRITTTTVVSSVILRSSTRSTTNAPHFLVALFSTRNCAVGALLNNVENSRITKIMSWQWFFPHFFVFVILKTIFQSSPFIID